MGKGHPAGDFLEAHDWKVLEEAEGLLRLRAHLPEHLKNGRGHLFGGYTPTYVDLVALFTVRAGEAGSEQSMRSWLVTTSMRVDYYEPVVGPHFLIEGRLVKRRGRTVVAETRFLDEETGELAVLALTTMRELSMDRSAGDG